MVRIIWRIHYRRDLPVVTIIRWFDLKTAGSQKKPRQVAGLKRVTALEESVERPHSGFNPVWHESVQLNLTNSPVWAE